VQVVDVDPGSPELTEDEADPSDMDCVYEIEVLVAVEELINDVGREVKPYWAARLEVEVGTAEEVDESPKSDDKVDDVVKLGWVDTPVPVRLPLTPSTAVVENPALELVFQNV
jgi:hypothetical protein